MQTQAVNTNFGGEVLSRASTEWSRRPEDERFTSLLDLQEHTTRIRNNSRAAVIANRSLEAQPDGVNGLRIVGPSGVPADVSHWAFGQLSTLAQAPAGYLRSLPAPMAADAINYGLHHARDVEEVGVLLTRNLENGPATMRAATGPNYGRIWNSSIVNALVSRFGDGVSGDWRIPGEFGKQVAVTKQNTTLYASDRDMFVFLADEENRIELPNRRDGRAGSLARGFFVWNSETGSETFGFGGFLFDFACSNRNVWGVNEYKEVRIRHTKGAPHKIAEQVLPALEAFAANNKEHLNTTQALLLAAQRKKIDDVEAFLLKRFSRSQAAQVQTVHMAEEGRPIETLWGASTGVTALAKQIRHQNERIELEREGGRILALAA